MKLYADSHARQYIHYLTSRRIRQNALKLAGLGITSELVYGKDLGESPLATARYPNSLATVVAEMLQRLATLFIETVDASSRITKAMSSEDMRW